MLDVRFSRLGEHSEYRQIQKCLLLCFVFLASLAKAADAARGESSLASSGSRRLLLAAAAAHPVLLEHTWTLVTPLLLPQLGNTESCI